MASVWIGCPVWSRKDWVGHLYSDKARPADYLRQYAEAFDAVEGNSTFYHPPSSDIVTRWCDAVPESFRFCFKLPRAITHERRLRGCRAEAEGFLQHLSPLGPRLGTFMIQLPPSFGPASLDDLDLFLAGLPREYRFAVELRHPAFYDDGTAHVEVDEVLVRHGAERVVMDTRPLRSAPSTDPAYAEACRKKPDVAVVPVALGPRPLVRYVAHPDPEVDGPWLERWAEIAAEWVREGREPYIFLHCPNDFHAPATARRFRTYLSEHLDLPPHRPWPAEVAVTGAQLGLF